PIDPLRQKRRESVMNLLRASSGTFAGTKIPGAKRTDAAMARPIAGNEPRRARASAGGAKPAARAEEDGRPRILLAEDNVGNQRVGVVMVEKRGYRVDVAQNGFEAIEAALRIRYSAVLMDCQMPSFDGYSATAHIRQREGADRRTPIIAMTANTGPGARERCI